MSALNVDASGAVTLAGRFSWTDFAVAGLPDLKSAGGNDIYVLRLDDSGVAQWAKSFGGRGYDHIRTVNTDSTGSVVLTGSSPGGTFGSRIGTGGVLYNFDPAWLAASAPTWEQNNLALFGNEAAGEYSVAFGEANIAEGETSFVWGKSNTAFGSSSTVWGQSNTAVGDKATAWGDGNAASGGYTTTWGQSNAASGEHSTIWGRSNTSSGTLATAWGYCNTVDGPYATAWGGLNNPSGTLTTAFG